MEDHLRAAVCYWHSFVATGLDMFGGGTFERLWFANDDMANAKLKADVAFEMFDILGFPFFTFHDRDIAPEGASLAQSNRNVREIAALAEIAARVERDNLDPRPRSGRQEYLENLVNRYL
jgi:xylose isomerase